MKKVYLTPIITAILTGMTPLTVQAVFFANDQAGKPVEESVQRPVFRRTKQQEVQDNLLQLERVSPETKAPEQPDPQMRLAPPTQKQSSAPLKPIRTSQEPGKMAEPKL